MKAKHLAKLYQNRSNYSYIIKGAKRLRYAAPNAPTGYATLRLIAHKERKGGVSHVSH